MTTTTKSLGIITPVRTSFRELSTGETIARTTVGAVLFLCWLLLFVFGMSLRSDDYRQYILESRQIDFGYLILYAVTFTPTNVAMLASLAGILGGFASNLAASNHFRYMSQVTIKPDTDEFNSYLYMTESPLVSMLRGFITYLIFIAGSYLTNFTISADPNDSASFVGLTAASYFKFAVSVSLLAYLAGYDPSRVKGLLSSINIGRKDPAPASQATTVTHQTTESVQVATTPAPATVNGQNVSVQNR